MAANLTVAALESILECPICYNTVPLTLPPCQHHICQACVGEIKQRLGDKFVCPECRAEYSGDFPVCRLTEYLRNESRKGIKSVQISGNESTVTCQLCDTNGNKIAKRVSDMRCTSCKKFICYRCSKDTTCGEENIIHTCQDINVQELESKGQLELWKTAADKQIRSQKIKLSLKVNEIEGLKSKLFLVTDEKNALVEDIKEKTAVLEAACQMFEGDIDPVERILFTEELCNSTSEPGMLRKIETSATVDSVLKAEQNPSNKYIDERPRSMIYTTIKHNVLKMVKKVFSNNDLVKSDGPLRECTVVPSADQQKEATSNTGPRTKLSQPYKSLSKDVLEVPEQRSDGRQIFRKEFSLNDQIRSCLGIQYYKGVLHNSLDVMIKLTRAAELKKYIESEAAVFRELTHANIVQLHAVCFTAECFYLIMELPGFNSRILADHLRDTQLNTSQRHDIAAQVAGAMAYLESHKYIHRDLSSRAVVVGENNTAKLCDFQRAFLYEEYIPKGRQNFAIRWTAPDAITENRYTIKTDVWSYGILLVEIWTHGKIPYPGQSNQQVIKEVINGYRHPKPENVPQALYEVMLQCWNKHPQERYTFEYLHSAFSDPEALINDYMNSK